MKTSKLVLSSCLMMAGVSVQAQEKPNVILILCDDLGWGDTGFNGNEVIQTPNLDAWAGDGIKFNRFYSASAVSSPTRVSCLTGRNPYRTGMFHAGDGILREEEVTIPELLKEEGYTSGHFGKWHLGTLTYSEKDANHGNIGNEKEYNPPKNHGYDDAFVTESKVPTWDPMKKPTGKVRNNGWNALAPDDPYVAFGTYYWDIDGNKVTDNLEGDDSRVIMDRVLPFIQKSKDSDTPFAAVIWFHTPHMPCVAGPEYAALYEGYNDDFKNFAGCVTAMDEQVGRLRAFLAENGLEENTMVWFCSDNGPENCIQDGGGVTGGFRDRKRSLHEGGLRVPAFMAWPKVVKEPFETDAPAVTSDYLPTIVSALGIDKKKCVNELDGVDLMPLVKGKKFTRKTPIVSCLVDQASYSDENYKIYIKKNKLECYDILKDPYETTPLTTIPKLDKKLDIIDTVLKSYQNSFMGGEYGTKSYDKFPQEWRPACQPIWEEVVNVAE
ncbi:MAG: sulfatase-like hydrolase/transferase [Rikenellaceae bacterium]